MDKFKSTKEFDQFCKQVEKESLLFNISKIVDEAEEEEAENDYTDMPLINNDAEFDDIDYDNSSIFNVSCTTIELENNIDLGNYKTYINNNNFDYSNGIINPKNEFIDDLIRDISNNLEKQANIYWYNVYLIKVAFTPINSNKSYEYYGIINDKEIILLSDAWNLDDANEIVTSANIKDLKFDSLEWSNIYNEVQLYMKDDGFISPIQKV